MDNSSSHNNLQPFQDKPTYRISEVAYYYGVSTKTIYTWITKGLIDVAFTKAGQKRITRESLNEYRCRKFPVSNINRNNKK
jgi:excisionase family DNA binding protein